MRIFGFGCCHAYFGRYFQVFKISDCIPVQWKLMETHFWCTQNWFFFWCPITSNNRQASRWKVFLGSISFQENQNLETWINRRNVFRNKNKIQSREVLRCFLPIKCTHMLPEECYPLERKTRALKFSKLEVRHETSLTLKTHLPFFLEAAMGAGVRSRSARFGVREREKNSWIFTAVSHFSVAVHFSLRILS